MLRATFGLITIAAAGGLFLQHASAQDAPAAAGQMTEAKPAEPDTPGTGPYPALKESNPAFPNHVIYRPANLEALGKHKLGVMVWGNGGCSDDGASARFHLAEVASHGYLVIAAGRNLSGPDAEEQPRPREMVNGAPVLQIRTTAEDVRAGINWALSENARKDSPLYRRIDTKQIAAAGHSCGGLQALQIAGDARIRTVLVHNSGVFVDEVNPIGGLTIEKSILKDLHTPVLYFLGSPTDIAYKNGMDDFAQIKHVPVAVLNSDVGHGGTFAAPNGGAVAQVSVKWLNWQLRGDKDAAKSFSGPNCALCSDPTWKYERKKIN